MSDCREVAIGMIRLCEDDPREVSIMARYIAAGMDAEIERRLQKLRDGSRAALLRHVKETTDAALAAWFTP